MKTKYVLKGYVKDVFPDEEYAYYVAVQEEIIWDGKPYQVRHCSASIEEAKIFNSYQDALDEIQEYELSNFEPYPVCPICHKDYANAPALSRKDNKTEICPACGTKEALLDFKKATI